MVEERTKKNNTMGPRDAPLKLLQTDVAVDICEAGPLVQASATCQEVGVCLPTFSTCRCWE